MSKISKMKLNGVWIADTSIKQPVFVTMLMLLVVVMGLLAYFTMPVDLYPEIDIPMVVVSVPYPGASPESVAEQVADPIENELSTLSGIKKITSTSNEGITTIIAEFITGVNIDLTEQDVRSKVNAILPNLPSDVEDPVYQKIDPNQRPILSFVVTSKTDHTPLQLRKIVDDEIVPLIQQVSGVGSVAVRGGQERQLNVNMDLQKLQTRQILPSMIIKSLSSANVNRGLGSIDAKDLKISLRAPSMIQKPEDIGLMQITGTPYRVSDVAWVEDGVVEQKSYSRVNGKDAITVGVLKQSGSNTVEVADKTKEELAKVLATFPDLDYSIPEDSSIFAKQSADSAIEELIASTVAAMLVVLIFFRDLHNTLVTVIGMPVILIGTFFLIQLFGLTINVVTLLGLSISVGLVIDDAIVVRETVFRHVEQGEPPAIAASRATAEVALSVVAMTLTLIAVFVPVTFTTGITGIIFKSFGITVSCAMTLSLIEAFTMAPMTSAHLFKEQKKQPGHETKKHHVELDSTESDANLLAEADEDPGWMGRTYSNLLKWSLHNRFLVVLITIGILFVSIQAAKGLKFNFFPSSDKGQFLIGFELPPGSNLAATDKLARQAEEILLQQPEIKNFLTTVGDSGNSETGSFSVNLKKGHVTDEVIARMRPKFNFLPKLSMAKPGMGANSGGSGITGRDIQLSLQTTGKLKDLEPLLIGFQAEAKKIPGLVDIDTTYKPGKPELQFYLDPSKAGDIGVTNDDIAKSVRALINGEKATTFRKDGEDTDVVVRLQPGDRAEVEAIKSISVPTVNGNVPLGSLVTVKVESGPTTIRRYNRLNQVLIGANVVGRNVNEVVVGIKERLAQTKIPENVVVSFQGSQQSQQEGFGTLFIAMGLSILFVYMVLASQFGSFSQPFVIMLAMPFSFVGAFLALQLVHLPLDIISMIGLIMLMGLVVKNSILLVDFTNRLRDSGMNKHAALELAGAIRLRPILMTSFAMIIGGLPVALGTGEGSDTRRGLSIVIIGGMITSTFLTLLVVPTAYSLLDGLTNNLDKLAHWRPWRRAPKPPVLTDLPPSEAPALPTLSFTEMPQAQEAPRRQIVAKRTTIATVLQSLKQKRMPFLRANRQKNQATKGELGVPDQNPIFGRSDEERMKVR